MKKALLSILLCGFVLNNGYCFDGEHKITEDNLCGLFDMKPCPRCGSQRQNVLDSTKRFVKEFLASKVPSGRHKEKTIKHLLQKKKLNARRLERICADSMSGKIKVTEKPCSIRIGDVRTSGKFQMIEWQLNDDVLITMGVVNKDMEDRFLILKEGLDWSTMVFVAIEEDSQE